MLLVYLTACALLMSVDGARILGICPSPAPSHSRTLEALLIELAERGHEVTFASAVPSQLPPPSKGSFTTVFLDGGGVLEHNMVDIVGPNRDPLTESLSLWRLAPLVCKHELESPQIQAMLSDESIEFDLVIAEVFFFDCMLSLSHRYDAPLIGFTTHWPPPWTHTLIGNPFNPSINPNFFLPYGDKMTFLQRLHNTVHTVALQLARRWIYLPRQDGVVRSVFGEDTPSIVELETRTSLVLSNTHPLLNFPMANVPALIEVGGMHIRKAKTLPMDLEDFLDGSLEGVVVFSLGTMINSGNLSPEGLGLLISAMAAVPCAVLWRWDTEQVPGLPQNVNIVKWMPQRDVLAHPNVKLLVTHGGLLSAQEAMFEGVPRIVIPFFGDQRMNARRAVDTGVALQIDFYSSTTEQFVSTITQIVSNQTYAETAKRLSLAFKDQPESPLERAVFWTEYVIRHGRASHLKSAALYLSWYQLFLVDVIALVTTLVLLVSFLVFKLTRLISKQQKTRLFLFVIDVLALITALVHLAFIFGFELMRNLLFIIEQKFTQKNNKKKQ